MIIDDCQAQGRLDLDAKCRMNKSTARDGGESPRSSNIASPNFWVCLFSPPAESHAIMTRKNREHCSTQLVYIPTIPPQSNSLFLSLSLRSQNGPCARKKLPALPTIETLLIHSGTNYVWHPLLMFLFRLLLSCWSWRSLARTTYLPMLHR